MDKEWQTVKVELAPSFIANFYLKFFFAQGGLEIKSAKLIRTHDLEDLFKQGVKKVIEFMNEQKKKEKE
jgi:beta-glucosidase